MNTISARFKNDFEAKKAFKRHFDVSVKLVRADEDDESSEELVELAFSSEFAGERWFGFEILDHKPQSVRLDRLNGGGAVLVNHDDTDQVGVVVRAWIDSDRVGRCWVRFSRSTRGQEIKQDVLDGIRKLVSVRYQIHDFEVAENEDGVDVYRMIDWEPLEVSIVPIPFDPSVGVGRQFDEPQQQTNSQRKKVNTMTDQTTTTENETEAPDLAELQRKAQGVGKKAERDRINHIREFSEKHDLEEFGRSAIDSDMTIADFNRKALELIGERNNEVRASSSHDGDVDLSNTDKRNYSFTRLMNALANPHDKEAQRNAQFEIEVSTEAAKGFGSDFNVRGVFIPNNVLSRSLSAGGATAGAELVANELLSGSFIDVLRNRMSVLEAGAMMLPGLVGTVDVPRQTAGAAAGWIGAEDGDAPESEPTFDQVSLAPKDLACYTEVTRRLMQQSTPAIGGLVQIDLATAIALAMDKAVHYGTGTGGQPTGIANQTGINVLDLAAAAPTYAEILRMIKLVMEDNALIGSPSWFIDPNGWEALSTTPKQGSGVEGNFILGDTDRVKGYPYFNTNQIEAEEYFFGDYSQVLIGEWGGIEMNVDPYTHSLKGRTRFVVFKTADIAVRHPESFCYAHDGITP